jgi:hypothetical protein
MELDSFATDSTGQDSQPMTAASTVGGAFRAGVLTLVGLLAAHPQAQDLRLDDPAAEAARHEDAVAALLARHLAAVEEYHRECANLIADETHVIELYKDNGKREQVRTIQSDLIVYASPRGGATEYRDVRAVDGRAIDHRGDRAIELLSRAAGAESLGDELETINETSWRYGFKRRVRGFTMNEGSPDDLRRGFHLEIAGRDRIAGRDVIQLAYRQTDFTIPTKNRIPPPLPKEFGRAPLISQGRLWLDAETSQLWRSVWELAAPHPATNALLVMVHAESQYVPSRFGILVPQEIVIEWRDTFKHPRNGPPQFLVKQRDTFTYGEFRQFQTAARVVP